ncbi:bacterial regulatory protein, gntR family protein [Asticcacaulis biprosthecium C19]|uniref:Bacterial regulatory protein, gntR family protein n=2 Tax=Asticcacaulis biprosthecium TaxID=76891 RepID=F4QKL7_9CAUL|nr:bacterial regulatory protein, gntR family protein [Asticcacaulis biprosthecium C19]
MYMKFGFVFSQTDSSPMYQQIMEQIKQRIAVGDWPANTDLPSIRELAIDIKVSVITVKRAYLELEREGVIVTQQGRGSRVSDALNMRSLQREEMIQHLEQAGRLAKSLGLPDDKVMQILKQYLE